MTPTDFFAKNGYLGPIPFLQESEAEAVCLELQHSPSSHKDMPHYWFKNALFLNPITIAIAQSAPILQEIHSLLGPDILLWSAELIGRPPGAMHRWHVDIEHTAWEGITVWLPLVGVSSKSTLRFIPGSQAYPCIPQSLEGAINLKNDNEVLAAAQKIDPEAKILSLEMQPGQFVLFAGKMWHSTINQSAMIRQALLLQYCRPDADVRIPLNHAVPTRWRGSKPWVWLIAGEDRYGINLLHE